MGVASALSIDEVAGPISVDVARSAVLSLVSDMAGSTAVEAVSASVALG